MVLFTTNLIVSVHISLISVKPVVFDRFLNLKIQEGEAHNIFCPAFDCFQLVPVEVIESVVSIEMDRRYLQFDIKVHLVWKATLLFRQMYTVVGNFCSKYWKLLSLWNRIIIFTLLSSDKIILCFYMFVKKELSQLSRNDSVLTAHLSFFGFFFVRRHLWKTIRQYTGVRWQAVKEQYD